MLYALVSIGHRTQRSRWSDSEETLPLTQLKPQQNGTWRMEDELTTTPRATERAKLATDSGARASTTKLDLDDLDDVGGETIPETIMIENDLYETEAVNEHDTDHGSGSNSGVDSDSSSDCSAACYNAPTNLRDIDSLSADVSWSGDGELSAEGGSRRPVLTPLDLEMAWRPFHDYDVVYTPRSDAGAMVRRVDSTGYVKSKLQRNHAYEEVRVDRSADGSAVVTPTGRMPPCVTASPALPPRRTPAASPALPPHRTPAASPALPSPRTPAASPALPPRWMPRAMSPSSANGGPASPPLPPRGSSRTPTAERTTPRTPMAERATPRTPMAERATHRTPMAERATHRTPMAERATPRPPRRNTSVPSSPVARHTSPPPIPLPPTPPVMRPRAVTKRRSVSGQLPQTPTEQSSRDIDPSSSDEEHDYDAVTESPAAIRHDLGDHRYSDVGDHSDHRYSANSTDSESNRDNVYEQINFEPT